MGWHSVDVDGRKMWESSSGERVLDIADIPDNKPIAHPPRYIIRNETPRRTKFYYFMLGVVVGTVFLEFIYRNGGFQP